MKKIFIWAVLCGIYGKLPAQTAFDKQGHRGARGLMPENTIPAMKLAQDLGVTLEMDIAFSQDTKVIVAHDPWVNPIFSLSPEGKEIPKSDANENIFFKMNYKDIRKFDVGSKFHKDFPQQKKLKTYVPLLSELIDSVEAYARLKKYPAPLYNIETKTKAKDDNIYHPAPEKFVKELVKVIKKKKIQDRVMIQSFDTRTLEIIRRDHPKLKTSYLVGKGELMENLKQLSFTPDIYSPHYKLVTAELVKKAHELNMKVIPWTVNSKEEIEKLKRMGVDGIISDYPNLF